MDVAVHVRAAVAELMTYCVGLLLERGIVMLSDTRTNAGFDNIACYRKMFVFEEPGERVLVLMTAGNLSVTQTVIAKLRHEVERADAGPRTSVLQAETMLEAAEIVGRTLNDVHVAIGERMERTRYSASASMLLGGQRRGGQMRLFLIYPGGQLHRGDRRHAVPADRRAQVRQADPRPGGAARRPASRTGARRC